MVEVDDVGENQTPSKLNVRTDVLRSRGKFILSLSKTVKPYNVETFSHVLIQPTVSAFRITQFPDNILQRNNSVC